MAGEVSQKHRLRTLRSCVDSRVSLRCAHAEAGLWVAPASSEFWGSLSEGGSCLQNQQWGWLLRPRRLPVTSQPF